MRMFTVTLPQRPSAFMCGLRSRVRAWHGEGAPIPDFIAVNFSHLYRGFAARNVGFTCGPNLYEIKRQATLHQCFQ